jgi:ribosome biogenesis GTPase
MDGIIVAKSFNQYLVAVAKRTYKCQMPKTMRRSYSGWPGDYVDFNANSLQITAVKPYTRLLQRPRIANLEQLFIVMSVAEPEFSWPLVYRYISYAYYNQVNPMLVISKVDKVTGNLPESFQQQLAHLEIPVFYYSKYSQEGVAAIKDYLPGKISAFAGQSGVGKSSLINDLCPDYKQTIGSYSKALGRGRHETKAVTLFPFDEGYIADTPGFSSLELDFGKNDLAQFFPGFAKRSLACRFPNCLHRGESGCEITKRVKDGKIPKETYAAYLELLETLPFRKDHY